MPGLVERAVRRAASAADAAQIVAAAVPHWLSRSGARPEVVLHAGQHKTGSTSLQTFIGRSRAQMAAQGVHIVRTGQSLAGDHHRLVLARPGALRTKARLALLRAEFAQAAASRLLISSETATELIHAGGGHGLIDLLRAAGAGKVTLLLYLRSPVELANSAYSEVISGLEFGNPDFAEFLASWNETAYLHYDHFLELAERGDVVLKVRSYGPRAQQSIVRDFLDTLDLDLPVDDEPRVNGSLGPAALEAIRLLSKELAPLPREVRWRVSERLRGIGRALPEQPFWGMDCGHRRLIADFEERTERFAQAVWGTGWKEQIGDEGRGRNVYDPACPDQGQLVETALQVMRAAATEIIGLARRRG